MLSKLDISNAIKLLTENKVVILPTDSIYGLSALHNKENELKLNTIKRSEQTKQLIVLFSKLKQIKNLIKIDKNFKKNLKFKEPITQIVNSFDLTIALRKIKRKDIVKIINKTGPIYSTSVNYAGNPFLNKKEELDLFNIEISEVFWDGELKGKPSKIIDLVNQKVIRD